MIIIWLLKLLGAITSAWEFLLNGERMEFLFFRFNTFQQAMAISLGWNYLFPIADLLVCISFIIMFELVMIGLKFLMGFLSIVRGGGHIEV